MAVDGSASAHIRIQRLTKAYGSTRVLNEVDIAVHSGEVHALLGPNGAGKSTLIKLVSGATRPDSGTISIAGREFAGLTPKLAFEAGVSVIYQNFSLIPALSIVENVFLGDELHRAMIVRRAAQRERVQVLFDQMGVDLPVDGPVSRLTVAEKQLVEIAKALHRNAALVIFDEPTAALSDAEVRTLLTRIRGLAEQGVAVLYVTHLLDEVFAVADRVTVVRDGAVVLSAPVPEVDAKALFHAIVGAVENLSPARGRERLGDRPALKVEGLRAPGLGPASFDLYEGEIVGIFGLLGAGRTELLETIYGVRHAWSARLWIGGSEYQPRGPDQAIRRGIMLVPGERARQSMLSTQSALDNLLLPSFRRLARGGVRGRRRETDEFRVVSKKLGLRPPNPDHLASRLSGGNQQKVAVGRWLTSPMKSRVLMLDEPTQGIDVGARAELYQVLRTLADGPRAVLFTSSSPEEVSLLAHRALVMRKGHIVAELQQEEISDRRLLEAANGMAGDAA